MINGRKEYEPAVDWFERRKRLRELDQRKKRRVFAVALLISSVSFGLFVLMLKV